MDENKKIPPLEKEIAFPGKFSDALSREVDLTPEVLSKALDGTIELMNQGYRVPAFDDHFTTKSNDVLGYWVKLWIDEKGSLKGLFEALTGEIRERVKKLDSSLIIQDNVRFGTRNNGLLTVPTAITRVDIVPQGAAVGTERFREAFAMAFASPSLIVQSDTAMIYMAKGAVDMAGIDNKEEKAGGLMSMLAAAFGLEGQAVSEEILEKLFVNQVLGSPEDVPGAMQALVKNGAAAMAAFDPSDVADAIEEIAEDAEEGEASLMPPEEKPGAALMPPEPVDEEKAALRAAAMSGLLATPGLDKEDKKSIQSLFDEIHKTSGNFMLAFNSAKSVVGFRSKDPAVIALNSAKPKAAASPAKRKVNKRPQTEEEKNFEVAMSAANPLIEALEKSGRLGQAKDAKEGQGTATSAIV